MGFARNFFIGKVPCTLKNSLRPHIPCASGNRLYNVYSNRYRIYGLKAMQSWFCSTKFDKNQILITQLIILFRKTQCNCVLIKVFVQFLKNRKDRCGGEADFRRKFLDQENWWGIGATPQGLSKSLKFVYILHWYLFKNML